MTHLFDGDKSSLLDGDDEAVHIAEALNNSPHIIAAGARPGEDTVAFTSTSGLSCAVTLRDADPAEDDGLSEPALVQAVAAAILNHPRFVLATPEADTVAIQTRDGVRYRLDLGATPHVGQNPSASATRVADAADQLLTSVPSASDRAVAELLTYVAATWNHQDTALREHAQTVARTLTDSSAATD